MWDRGIRPVLVWWHGLVFVGTVKFAVKIARAHIRNRLDNEMSRNSFCWSGVTVVGTFLHGTIHFGPRSGLQMTDDRRPDVVAATDQASRTFLDWSNSLVHIAEEFLQIVGVPAGSDAAPRHRFRFWFAFGPWCGRTGKFQHESAAFVPDHKFIEDAIYMTAHAHDVLSDGIHISRYHADCRVDRGWRRSGWTLGVLRIGRSAEEKQC